MKDIEILKPCTKSFLVRLPDGRECYVTNRLLFKLYKGLPLSACDVRLIHFPNGIETMWLSVGRDTMVDKRNFGYRRG